MHVPEVERIIMLGARGHAARFAVSRQCKHLEVRIRVHE
jgi:hypothetical protein